MRHPTTHSRKSAFRAEDAEATALRALQFLAEDESAFAAFCAASGLTPSAIRSRAAEPEFLGAILDFLLEREDLLLAFCAWAEIPPETPALARRALPGGESLEF